MQPVSIVIPAHNEAGNIAKLVSEIFEVVPDAMIGEVIVVDDASADTTAAEVLALRAGEPRVRLIRHDRKSGQSRAVRTGVEQARFPVIATLDGDGQNPPADIPRLVAAFSFGGPQLVGGHRTERRDTLSKRLASKAANAIRIALLRDDCPDTGCGLKVFPRDVYLALPFFNGQHRYLPALMRANGCTGLYLPVGDRTREHGRSNYTNVHRAVVGFFDLFGVAWLLRRARPVTYREDEA